VIGLRLNCGQRIFFHPFMIVVSRSFGPFWLMLIWILDTKAYQGL
jgi:hypothetical protein